MNYCIYGTVYNNVNYVEDSIKSFFSPIYDKIVIVDSYSTDGTYEKLKEMEKDYNLTILRLKSSRGKGRDYALRHCPEGSFTAYVDLDATYNKNLEKAIELEIDKASMGTFQPTFIAKRETILNKGGWKDLMMGEDVELIARVGINAGIPITIGNNAPYYGNREQRYSKSKLKQIVRRGKALIDGYRSAFDFKFKLNKYLILTLTLYTLAVLKGKIRYSKELGNIPYTIYLFLNNLKDPHELGFRKEDVVAVFAKDYLEIIKKKVNIDYDNIITTKISYLKRELNIVPGYIVYYYDSNVLNYVKLYFH